MSTGLGGFYLCTAGINAGLAMADAQVYRHVADRGLFSFVREGWADIVMAHPVVWALLLAGGEAAIGTALLLGGGFARVGWVAVLAFQALLMLFGWGFWLWSVPALLLVGALAWRDWPRLGGPASTVWGDRSD